jgi:hypothetical protein
MNKTLIAALLAASAPVLAADADVIGKLDPAWKGMEKRVIALVGQQGQRQLLDMAYAQVAVDACPGLALNGKTIDETFGSLLAAKRKDAAEYRHFENKVMTEFGTYTGLVLAESFIDKPAFCQAVAGIKSKPVGPGKYWTAK